MTKTPIVAFCITCKGRAQHIKETLPRNLADNGYGNARFILLDYNSADGLVDYLKCDYQGAIANGRLIIYSYRDPGPFRMAHAKNMAHRLGMLEGADILVNLDADNFTGPEFGCYVAEQFKTPGIFLWANMVKGVMGRGCSGRIVVSAHAFLKLGGYDEKYETWSPDDKDFNTRLRRIGYTAAEIPARYLDVIRHNDKMRFREYKHAQTGTYDEWQAVHSSDATVVNYGNFGCGTVFRNFCDVPTELRPLPTRIFGIGMHKTATTSLCEALAIMGYESAHWRNAHWAKAIWTEMNTTGRSLTLEKWYALTDLPIPVLLKKLDAAYPGSKFILTLRNEERWIRSVENHWNPAFNKFRSAWNKDPFTHKIHREVYGQKGFDRDLFLARYRQHNADVIDYFKNRPDDLLVMNMEHAGWPTLCTFLHQRIPSVHYPRKFTTDHLQGTGDGI